MSLLTLSCGLVAAQQAPAQAANAAAQSARPDFSGFWRFKEFKPGVMRAGIVPFKPAYEARIVEVNRIAAAGGDVPTVSKRCLPFGMPFGMEFFAEILFAPYYAVIVAGDGPVRHVWLDGRQHTPDNKLFESLNGESIGHWEGDTLVVDTSGIQTNELILGVPVPGMHVVERFRLSDADTLQISTTVTAPEALREPWRYVRHYARNRAETGFGSRQCDPERDRSVDPVTGQQRFDMTPPKGGFVPPGVTE